MIKPTLISLAVVAVIHGVAVAQSWAPVRDVVPDSKTAITAGGAFLEAYFGPKERRNSSGYSAKLSGEVWIVYEELGCTNCQGGGPVLEMSKRDGRVVRIYAEQ